MTRPVTGTRDLVSANVRRGRPWSKVRRFGRWLDESRPVMFPRRHPALALWGLVAAFLAVQLQVWKGPPTRPDFVPSEHDRRVESMARSAVQRSLDVIGHGIEVSSVAVEPMEWYAAATYTRSAASVRFAADCFFSADQLLHTAAHESVHAVFDQADLNPRAASPVWDSRLLVEEVAAEVLGAHIAGRVHSSRGGDGAELTRRLVTGFRNQCDLTSPESFRGRLWAAAMRIDFDHRLERAVGDSLAVHHGPLEMVDAIDAICRENPDPWVAAHVIAERFIEPLPEPIEVPPF